MNYIRNYWINKKEREENNMEVKKCPNCGAEIPEDREYCEPCEEQLKQTVGTSKREEINPISEPEETTVNRDEENAAMSETEPEQEVADNKEALPSQEKKKINKSKMKMVIPIVVGVIALVGAIAYLNSDMYTYNQGVKLYESEEYDNASEKFEGILDYKDAELYLQKCYIEQGNKLYNKGNYEDALEAYSQVTSDYEDTYDEAHERSRKCAYQIASDYVKDGEYETALYWLEKYWWSDDKLAKECKYNLGKKCYDSEDYNNALTYLQSIDYEDSKEVATACKYYIGKQYYDNGDYDNALTYLQDIDYEDSKALVDSMVNNPMSINKFIERYNNIIDALSGDVEYLSSYKLDANQISDNRVDIASGASTIYFRFNALSEKDCKYEVDYVQFYVKGWVLMPTDLLEAIQFALYGAYSPNTSPNQIPNIIEQVLGNESSYGDTSHCAATVDGVEYIASKSMKELMITVQNAQ